jgi:hypothetical protein
LKLVELAGRSLAGFEVWLRNARSFVDEHDVALQEVAVANRVVLCDPGGVSETRVDLLDRWDPTRQSRKKFVAELFGFGGIGSALNRSRKAHPCTECGGKGKFELLDLDRRVERLTETCSLCSGGGLDPSAHGVLVEGVPIGVWMRGTVGDLIARGLAPTSVAAADRLLLCRKVEELSKGELAMLVAACPRR